MNSDRLNRSLNPLLQSSWYSGAAAPAATRQRAGTNARRPAQRLSATVKLSLLYTQLFLAEKDGIIRKYRLLFPVANGYTDSVLLAVFCIHQFKAAAVFSSLLTLDGMFPGSPISTVNSR